MSICETFKRLAFDTWDKINQGRSVNFQLKEETLTDINILELKKRHGNLIKSETFTKHQEGENGADWEWWFKGKNGSWIAFRVQAKIINIKSDAFDHLHYKSATSGKYQCDKLIKHALQDRSHPKIPLYCYFIHSSSDDNLPNWINRFYGGPVHRFNTMCLGCTLAVSSNELYGCSLTSAFTVRDLRPSNANQLSDLKNSLRPWHCLVCCQPDTKQDYTYDIQAYARNNFLLDRDAARELEVEIPNTFIIKEAPAYILAIDRNEYNNNIPLPDGDIDGAIIIREG